MRNKLFVSNISPSLSEADLSEMFAAFNPLFIKIDRKKNSAVIEVAGDVLENVVEKLDGSTVDGQQLTVSFSVLIEPRAQRGSAEDDLRPPVIRLEEASRDGQAKLDAPMISFGIGRKPSARVPNS